MQLQLDEWQVKDLDLTPPKVAELWRVIQRHKAIFSDLTRNDVGNFVRCLTAPHTIWLEVRKHGALVGLMWFGEMQQVIDIQGHMLFFDRRPAEKRRLCQLVIKEMFRVFPLQRITVEIPSHKDTPHYKPLNRLLSLIGFVYEGKRRQAALINKMWYDMLIFGMTRKEVATLP